MLPGYMKGIEAAGGIPIILPLTSDREAIKSAAGLCDGLLLTGGQDVSPALYGQEIMSCCGEICPSRDEEEAVLCDLFISTDRPVLGICRGIQFLNAHLGGTLYQDINSQYGKSVEHHMSPPYDRAVHTVSILPSTPLFDLLFTKELGVNSYHHQAIKKLAPSLCQAAISSDGLIEAVYMPDKKFVWAVQWHPEFSYEKDPCSLAILKAFTKASAEKRSEH